MSWVQLSVGANFQAKVKKISLSAPHQSTGLRPGPSHWSLTQATVPLCKGGTGVQGLLDLREKVFLKKYPGAVLPPVGGLAI
jgi:hypothetical protein